MCSCKKVRDTLLDMVHKLISVAYWCNTYPKNYGTCCFSFLSYLLSFSCVYVDKLFLDLSSQNIVHVLLLLFLDLSSQKYRIYFTPIVLMNFFSVLLPLKFLLNSFKEQMETRSVKAPTFCHLTRQNGRNISEEILKIEKFCFSSMEKKKYSSSGLISIPYRINSGVLYRWLDFSLFLTNVLPFLPMLSCIQKERNLVTKWVQWQNHAQTIQLFINTMMLIRNFLKDKFFPTFFFISIPRRCSDVCCIERLRYIPRFNSIPFHLLFFNIRVIDQM